MTQSEIQMAQAILRNPVRILSREQIVPEIIRNQRVFSLYLMADLPPSVPSPQQCKLVKIPLYNYESGFPFQKEKPCLASAVSKAIQHVKYLGLVDAQKRMARPQPCALKSVIEQEFVAIPLHPVLGIFIFLLLGCTVSLAVFIVEIAKPNVSKKQLKIRIQ